MYVNELRRTERGIERAAGRPGVKTLDESRCVGQAEAGHEKALFAFREAGGEPLLGR